MSESMENYTNLPVGEILRRVRFQYNLSLAQVEENTRIKSIYLEALEVGDFERLPGKVYVTGFVKVYSDYLGLDSDKMVQLLKRQTGHQVKPPAQIFPVATEEQKVPGLKVILISLALLVLTILVWKLNTPGLQNDDIPAVPEELNQQLTALQKPEEPDKSEEVVTAEAAPVQKAHPVVLKATQDVWLEIRDGAGQPIFSRVLKLGEEYWVPEEAQGYKMTTGNAGGLETIVEGTSYPAMGRKGEVRRNISLNPADLKAQFAAALPSPN
ncbi:MAG: hypothetical protein DI586_10170 [Micavibrio aeruginosavorus]|uniref:Cytoskeleton protein RodZ-like C-terminal domain-containing protein n=1 Tax=Micavibrio aeruginosavorus TaxID=349221 RepID=A0A2W5FDQ8_9BACT|nr:MAG: hypothetical protein DI586_10170 [Micavibrio aeruginosavorus]